MDLSKLSNMLRLTLILGVLLAGSTAFVSRRFSKPSQSDFSFDVLRLSQEWPQTACWFLNKDWPGTANSCTPCKLADTSYNWTIHGLWPNRLDGNSPFFCNQNIKFDQQLLDKDLLDQMKKKWLTYKLTNTNIDFWSYEWDKHGTCALQLPATNSLPKYFNATIRLLNEYNVGQILANAEIKPGKTYKYKNVANAIQKAIGFKVDIDCAEHSLSNEKYLNEISLCFNKSLKLTDCPSSRNKCGTDVWYPEKRRSCSYV